MTVHELQGITMEKAVLNLVEKDFAPGLLYICGSIKGQIPEWSHVTRGFQSEQIPEQRWQ